MTEMSKNRKDCLIYGWETPYLLTLDLTDLNPAVYHET
jgi:hypothetical protein